MSKRVREAATRQKAAQDAFLKEIRSTKITIGEIFDYITGAHGYVGSPRQFSVEEFDEWLLKYAEEK